MSDFSDVLFDPRQHTHTSCLQEISGCDLLVLVIGKRYGGRAVPQALTGVDFASLTDASRSTAILKNPEKLSITQLEVLKAIETSVPIFAFVDAGVLNDHQTYEKNKDKPILSQIEFPNIEKQETAAYIFEFINFIRHRASNNAIIPFSHLDDLREHLKKQWAALFQRLLFEQRHHREEAQRIDYISSQIADIKTAIFASLSSNQLKETAKGAIRFRVMVEFVMGTYRQFGDPAEVLREDISWQELLDRIGVAKVEHADRRLFGSIVILKDGTYFKCRVPSSAIYDLAERWQAFRSLDPATKDAIIAALQEQLDSRSGTMLRYMPEQYEPSQIELPSEPEITAVEAGG